ncbi:MAG: glycosyltransferase [Ignavibacteria bacterium]|nr:glycosyltransferase [Ignavibacteria bacterium]
MTPSKGQNIFNGDDIDRSFINSKSIDEKIREIEERIKNLSEKNSPDLLGKNSDTKEEKHHLKEKLLGVSNNIKQLSDELKSESQEKNNVFEEAYDVPVAKSDVLLKEKLSEIERRIETLDDVTSAAETVKETRSADEIINKRYSDLAFDINTGDETGHRDIEVKDKLEAIDKQIRDIKDSITSFYSTSNTVPSSVVEERLKSIEEKITGEKPKTAGKVLHGPITIRPKKKKEGLFNDVNLTEDYELGFRFYQLGFRTGFFNVKLDRDDEASRIATAEFFPNTFWASVKQRSRWVAGIVFQNWKAHKWAGNLSTKYFLFRDRKSIFSFFSAFLSNIVILYFLYAILSNVFGWSKPFSLVGNSSVLWYLMVANLVFMISRLSHRFVFTYNWYGFKYAFFSLFRLPLDTIINFFAIARSLNVYKKTRRQEKVVWDSTSHY